MVTTKVCTVCEQEKPIAAFAVSKRGKDGLHTFCKKCKSAKSRDWYHRTPDRQRSRNRRRYQENGAAMREAALRWYRDNREHVLGLKRASALRKSFGLTIEQYDEMLAAQGGLCAVCGQPPQSKARRPLHIDHCHNTGRVRGLLCRSCNVGLGHFADSPERLRAAAAYIERRSDGRD